MARERGLILRFTPEQADALSSSWKEMRRLKISEDYGENLHDALIQELLNILIRWNDTIMYAKEKERS